MYPHGPGARRRRRIVLLVNNNILRNLGSGFSVATTGRWHDPERQTSFPSRHRLLISATCRNVTSTPASRNAHSGRRPNDVVVISAAPARHPDRNRERRLYRRQQPARQLDRCRHDTLNGGGGNDILFGRFGNDSRTAGGDDSPTAATQTTSERGADTDNLVAGAATTRQRRRRRRFARRRPAASTRPWWARPDHYDQRHGWTVTSSDGTAP